MAHATMLPLLLMWGFIALSLSQEQRPAEVDSKKPGDCPEQAVANNMTTQPPCPEPCTEQSCPAPACTVDTDCLGSFKCCKARCGMECLPASFRSPCRGNFDCPWTLECCSGVCDSDCVHQPKIPNPVTEGPPKPKKKPK